MIKCNKVFIDGRRSSVVSFNRRLRLRRRKRGKKRMNKATPTPFTDTNGLTPMSVYLDAENAIAPIEDALHTLEWAYVDFHLGYNRLDKEDELNLLTNYQSLGALILCAAHTLEKVVEDFEKVNPKHKEKAQTQSNPESAN